MLCPQVNIAIASSNEYDTDGLQDRGITRDLPPQFLTGCAASACSARTKSAGVSSAVDGGSPKRA